MDHATPASPTPDESDSGRACPWCGSQDTHLFRRGLTGPTDERDQYVDCHSCGKRTYEIVSRTSRDMRLGQFRAGGIWRDATRSARYTITRVLKVGVNEVLLYVRPIIPTRESPDT